MCRAWKLGDDADVGLCLVGSVPLPDMVAEIALLREMALTSSTESESPTQARAQATALFQALPQAIRMIDTVDDLLAIKPWSMIFGGAKEDYSQAVRSKLFSQFSLQARND